MNLLKELFHFEIISALCLIAYRYPQNEYTENTTFKWDSLKPCLIYIRVSYPESQCGGCLSVCHHYPLIIRSYGNVYEVDIFPCKIWARIYIW